MSYNKLLIEADKQNIIVKEINFKEHDGLCVGNVILIKESLSEKEKKCVLAEELGHFHKTVGNITDQTNMDNRKQELIARKWGYEKLVGLVDLINAYNSGIKNRFELAEFLDVTDDFLNDSIEYYKSKYGTHYEINNYTIYFEPSFGILKLF